MNKLSTIILSIFFVFAFLTCNDDGGGEGGTSRETIGPEGGEITSADGRLTLTFPPGALLEDTEITIRKINPEDLPPEFDGVGPEFAYLLEPEGIEFAVPVKATLMLDEEPVQDDGTLETGLAILITSSDGELEVLENLTIEVDGDAKMTKVSGELSHFSLLVLGTGRQIRGITQFVSFVPDVMAVGGRFTALVEVRQFNVEKITIDGPIEYVDGSNSPIKCESSCVTSLELIGGTGRIPGLPLIADRTVPYTCTSPGIGKYASKIRYRFTYTGEFGPTGFVVISFSKQIACSAPPPPPPPPSPSPLTTTSSLYDNGGVLSKF